MHTSRFSVTLLLDFLYISMKVLWACRVNIIMLSSTLLCQNGD